MSTIQELLKDPSVCYLKQLSNPERPRIDIVAVHGLRISPDFNSESFGARAWVAGKGKSRELWLSSFLPEDIKGARVFFYGYNSNAGRGESTADINDVANDLLARLKEHRRQGHGARDRPLVFLCHSNGGLVVKQAIAQARASIRYKRLYNSVGGIAFFATPHRGGRHAKLLDMLLRNWRLVRGLPRCDIVEALRKDSSVSFGIHRNFLASLGSIHICSFHETLPMPLVGVIVDKRSAIVDLPEPQEVLVAVPQANHSTICKFATRNGTYADVVLPQIRKLVEYSLKRRRGRRFLQRLLCFSGN